MSNSPSSESLAASLRATIAGSSNPDKNHACASIFQFLTSLSTLSSSIAF